MKQASLLISRKKLLNNYNFFKSKLAKDTKIITLVKANGYGMGDIQISSLIQEFGGDYLGVATTWEGIRLANNGIYIPIMVLNPLIDTIEDIVKHKLEPAVINITYLKSLIKFLESNRIYKYPVHINLDTGMQRAGVDIDQMQLFLKTIKETKNIHIKSAFTHLAAADEPQHDIFTQEQIDLFFGMTDEIEKCCGYSIQKHALNSWGIQRFNSTRFDMVRLGIGLYGTGYDNNQESLYPVADFVAPIIHIKEAKKGTVGYGRHGIISQNGDTIATICAGYADGIDRRLGNGAIKFLLNGKLVPTIGNICMDTTMLNISGIDAKIGDTVTIFGTNPHPNYVADILKTISYEVLTSVSNRVERVIID
jgi:alanine racemase